MRPTARFTERAGAYATGRPSYPPGAIDALLDGLGDPADVLAVDLGAGTGISSRLLADRGVRVLAVEPNAAMRAAAEPHAGVEWIDGTAEATTLEEASADLVAAFQAFHWFDAEAALRETVRILRPAGRAAVVYNERDESDRFTAAYGEVIRRHAVDDTERRRATGLAEFAAYPGWHDVRHVRVPNEHVLDEETFVARGRSTSYIPHDGAAGDAVERELRETFSRFAHHGRVVMRFVTLVAIASAGADGA